MKLRFPVLALTLALSTLALNTPAAHAQVGLYFNPVVTRVSISTPDSGPFAFLGQNTTSAIFGGVDIGGYYTFYHAPKFDASVDMRDAIEHGNSALLNSFLVGLRLQAKPTNRTVKPYAQISLGDGRTKSPVNPIPASKLVYDIYAGLDYPIGKHVDFRVIEVGYGSVKTIGSDLYGGATTIPNANLINFSTGLVFRIP